MPCSAGPRCNRKGGKLEWPWQQLIRYGGCTMDLVGDHWHKNGDVLLYRIRTCCPLLRRLDWAAGSKASGATNNLSFWQLGLDDCHLSPADHAGSRDICSPSKMRSLGAFHRPADTFALIALDLSIFTHLSYASDWAWTQRTCSLMLSGHYKTTRA